MADRWTQGDAALLAGEFLPESARRTEKVSEVIARRIVKDIVNRDMKPGDVLPPESQMVERFRVGRASLREALRILEVQGLITIKSGPGGGPIVAAPDSRTFGRMATLYFEMSGATFGELVEARLVLEPIMARRAALRNDPDVIAELQRVVSYSEELLADPAFSRVASRVASDFHGAISSASGNRILDLFSRGIKEVYHERVSGMVYEPEHHKRIREDHRSVVDAIAIGNADKAEMLMRFHMEEFVERIKARYPGMLDEVVDWR
jgi:GntR family transcriptional repressor for pyruvate dehydrogenase complex